MKETCIALASFQMAVLYSILPLAISGLIYIGNFPALIGAAVAGLFYLVCTIMATAILYEGVNN